MFVHELPRLRGSLFKNQTCEKIENPREASRSAEVQSKNKLLKETGDVAQLVECFLQYVQGPGFDPLTA